MVHHIRLPEGVRRVTHRTARAANSYVVALIASVVVLTSITVNTPPPVYIATPTFTCTTPEILEKYVEAYRVGDSKYAAKHRLAGRCLDTGAGEITMVVRHQNTIQFQNATGRTMYVLSEFIRE